jgi:hypothetical protein
MSDIYELLEKHYIKFESHEIKVIIDNLSMHWFMEMR